MQLTNISPMPVAQAFAAAPPRRLVLPTALGRRAPRTLLIEKRRRNELRPAAARYPADAGVETHWFSGPVFVTFLPDGFVERATGLAFDAERRLLRESAMGDGIVEKLAARYADLDFSAAEPLSEPAFVVSNQRQDNYCRWWLDTMAKFHLFERAFRLHLVPAARRRYVVPDPSQPFHAGTFASLALANGLAPPAAPLLRGAFYISSGLTYAGGQNISPELGGFRSFLFRRLRPAPEKPTPRRVYVSRERTTARRIANEAALMDILGEAGFAKVLLEERSVEEQIRLFRGADIVAGAHGAGLTNVLFCAPGAKLLEFFPEGGLHASSFMRMASLLDLDYAFFCGGMVRNSRTRKNPRSADIECDLAAFRPFLRDLLARWT